MKYVSVSLLLCVPSTLSLFNCLFISKKLHIDFYEMLEGREDEMFDGSDQLC